MNKSYAFVMTAAVCVTAAGVFAQGTAREQLVRGNAFWDQRLAKSAIAALDAATRDKGIAAEAHEALGRIYTFKGWQQESAFPGWHDEPGFRERALTELKAAVAADPARASAQEALRTAQAFAAADRVDPAPPRPEIKALDAKLQAAATAADIAAAVDARAKAQADAAPYFTGAQLLIDRGDYDKAIALAERGATVSDRFVDENLSAYQMSGKSQGSKARGHATAADLIGWAQFMKKNYAAAAEKLGEAERLSQGLDFATEFHMGELARHRRRRRAPATTTSTRCHCRADPRRCDRKRRRRSPHYSPAARLPADSTRGSRRSSRDAATIAKRRRSRAWSIARCPSWR